MNALKAVYLVLIAVGTAFMMPQQLPAQVYYTETGYVEFHSTVPLHSFTGASDHLVGKISLPDSIIDFYVDVHTLKTGISMRDDDMLETLQANKYSFIGFYGKLITGFNPSVSEPQAVIAKGEFSIHGVSNPLKVRGTLQKTAKGLQLKASWSLNMRDYDIEPPGILFYRVSEVVDISINVLLPPKTPDQ